MEGIYQQLTEDTCFKKVQTAIKNEAAIPTGCFYSDRNELILYMLNIKETIVLTDNGQTIDYIDNIFELTSPDVIKHIRAITDYYEIRMKKQKLALSISSIDDFIEGYLKMLFCTDFMDSMKIFYQ